jgi:energy-converting hydrogenase Eha subunit H
MEITIVLVLLALIVVSVLLLVREIQDVRDDAGRLAARLRMPQDAQEKILNAMAAIVNLRSEGKVIDELVANAQAWLADTMAIGTKRKGR